jgi:superfamily II DNA/RNA helicase
LAQQVATDAIDLVAHCRGLRVASVVGGTSYVHQLAGLRNANVVVATPGRLLDLQKSGQIRLDKVQYLVVDEADRMLDLGFAEDLAEVHALTKDRAQTMMFSATFAPRVQQLAMRVMRKTERIELATPESTHDNIEQRLYWADNAFHKRQLLDHFLRDTEIKQAIVFSSTQIECDSLAEDLQQDGFSAVALHGALGQGVRNRRLAALRDGSVQILVATDVAARGIDVPTITHVFNFGLPMKAEDYTHRIGRTGRAGRQGLAVTLAEFRDQRRIYAIESFTRKRFDEKTVEGMEPSRRPSHNGGGNDRRGNGGPRRSGGAGFGGVPGFGANRGGGGRREGGGGYAPRAEGFQGRGQFGGGRPQEGRFEPRSEGRFDARSQGRPEFRDDRRFEERAAPRQDARFDPRFADRSDRGGRFENRAPRPEGRAHGAPARGRDDRRAAPARSTARR